VKKVLRGYQCEETSRFIAFRSHWRFQSEFCNPARGNEKGGVEGEGGYFRRNHWVPLPEARDLGDLNAYLERCCQQDQQRILHGRTETVGAAMLNEQPHLRALATEPFELTESSFPTVDGLRCVRVRTNRYSTPLPPGTRVEAKLRYWIALPIRPTSSKPVPIAIASAGRSWTVVKKLTFNKDSCWHQDVLAV
jgi:hypothetical protein